MSANAEVVRDEFDRLSRVPDEWNFNAHYHPLLLSYLPARIGSLLDAGCGAGAFARAVAPRCERVTAIDVSPRMIDRAIEQPVPPNVEFSVADVFADGHGTFDAIVSIAAVHHMGVENAFTRFAALLRPGGTLVILDLFSPSNIVERLASVSAAVLAPAARLLESGRLLQSRASREAWAGHEQFDHYPTIPFVRSVAATILPGARVRPHLFWRYSLLYQRSAAGPAAVPPAARRHQ